MALGVGYSVRVAYYIGAGETELVRTCLIQAVLGSLILGIGAMAIGVPLSKVLPKWMGAAPAIRQDAFLYMLILMVVLPGRTFHAVFSAILRCMGDTRTPMIVNTLINLLNVVLNFFLIFPTRAMVLLGRTVTVPGAGWGVAGAAVATAISVVFSGSMMLVKVLQSKAISPRGMKAQWDRPVMTQCIKVGLPVALQNLGVFSGQVVFSAQVTSLGKTALAAHSIAITAEQAFYIPGFGMEAAASTLCGNALGERDERKLDRISRTVLMISVGLMTISGAILFAFPRALMSLFTQDAAVIASGAEVLRIVACSEPMYAALILFEGIYHGVGQTKFPFFVSLATMWGVRVLGTAVCVGALGLGLRAVWLCMVADNVARAVLLGIRYFSGKWKKTLDLKPISTEE